MIAQQGLAATVPSAARPSEPLPSGVFTYIWRCGGCHQIALLALSCAVFLLSAVPLEIQRRVVNDAIRNGALRPIVQLALAYLGIALLEGCIKLVLNIYRSWVSETAVLDLRDRVARLAAQPARQAAPTTEGTEISMILSEAEPIGGFAGISISEPLLQVGVLISVLGYLAHLQPLMALLGAVAISLQVFFVPLMQAAINRRVAQRIQVLREVGADIAGAGAGHAALATLHGRVRQVFRLNMASFRIKFSMNFLMNLMHHMSVATALGVGGYYVVRGQAEVGTVVAFVSGLGKVVDPWGDLINWFREMTAVRMRYRLLCDACAWLGPSGGTTGPQDRG